MPFTTKEIKQLRDQTGCGMMDCKKALTAADGDMDKAFDYLRERGLAVASKKAGRIAAEGMAYAAVSEDGKVGVTLEVNAETDFVAKNASFKELVMACAQVILEQAPADVDALLQCKLPDGSKTVDDLLKEKILTIGENMKVRRFARVEGHVASYIHAGGKICVLAQFDTSDEIAATPAFQEYAHNIGMQIAAMNPRYLNDASVPQDVIAHEKEIAMKQVEDSGKPANILEKMVAGKVKKTLKEFCLVDQPYVKEAKQSVQQYTDEVAKQLGGKIAIKGFIRYERGEGLEKRQDNFAEEIADLMK